MSRKGCKKDKEKARNEDEYSEGEEISDAMAAVEDGPDEGDDEVVTSGGYYNRDIMKAIMSLKSGLYLKIDGVQTTITEVRKEIKECTGRIAQAEQHISDAEDNGLISRVSTLKIPLKLFQTKSKIWNGEADGTTSDWWVYRRKQKAMTRLHFWRSG